MMNKFDKKIANPTKCNKRKYSYKSLSFGYFILYPLAFMIYWIERLKDKRWNNISWNEKRTIAVIERYLMKRAKVNQEKQTLSLWVREWGFFWRDCCMPWDKRYCDKFNGDIKKYFFENFQIEGYTKTVENDYDWTHVVFEKNK